MSPAICEPDLSLTHDDALLAEHAGGFVALAEAPGPEGDGDTPQLDLLVEWLVDELHDGDAPVESDDKLSVELELELGEASLADAGVEVA